jgi:hypothetical protein
MVKFCKGLLRVDQSRCPLGLFSLFWLLFELEQFSSPSRLSSGTLEFHRLGVLLGFQEDLAILGLGYEFWNLAPKCCWAIVQMLVGFVHGT